MPSSVQAQAWPPAAAARQQTSFAYVSDGFIRGFYFKILLLVAPIQSVLLINVQGTTPAFLLTLLAPLLLASYDHRYVRILLFCIAFLVIYSLLLAASMSAYVIDYPRLSGLRVIRDTFVYGDVRESNITQGIYLLAALLFLFLIYVYYQEAFLKYAFYGILLLAFYGYYEFVYYALYHVNGDFLSNRNFGDVQSAAGSAANGSFVTGSFLQQSNLFGANYMRLKSLVGEPSMYALTVTPFAVYAFARRWWVLFFILALSLVLSTSTTAVLGLFIGMSYVEVRRSPTYVVYFAAALFSAILLYITSDVISDAVDTLLFRKLDTLSGTERLKTFAAHASLVLHGNLIRDLFGLGFGTVRSTDMTSNLLANVGIVGLFAYSWLILAPCFLLKQAADRHAITASLLAIFAMEMMTVSEYAYLPPWFMVALGYARLRQQRSGAPFSAAGS